jgi:DNA mismatch endonuclease (patch repair protein)
MDTVPVHIRSRIMASITGTNTSPELAIRSFLHRLGFRFRLHCRSLPGRPDIVLAKYQTTIFIHGCFWHQHPGCKHSHIPHSNKNYWVPKLERNVLRDEIHQKQLFELGWNVVTIWECEIKEANQKGWTSLLVRILHRKKSKRRLIAKCNAI